MFGVFAIDEILRYRGSRIPGSPTLCHPARTYKDDCGAAPAVEQAGGFRLKSFNLLKTKHICLVTILAILPICALLQSTQVQLIEDKNGIGGHRGKHCPGCKLREGRQLEYVQVNNEHP